MDGPARNRLERMAPRAAAANDEKARNGAAIIENVYVQLSTSSLSTDGTVAFTLGVSAKPIYAIMVSVTHFCAMYSAYTTAKALEKSTMRGTTNEALLRITSFTTGLV